MTDLQGDGRPSPETRQAIWWGVVNPGARAGNDTLGRAQRALDGRRIEAALTATNSGEHLREVVAEGVEQGHRRFLAVGGDGTVNLMVDTLLQSSWTEPPVIGVLPAGSGCDLVRTFGISQDLTEAAGHLTGDATAPLDAVVLEGGWGTRYFVNSAGSGLTAGVVEQAERLPPRFGAFRYQLGIWPALLKTPHAQIEVTCGSERFTGEGDALMIVISNARFLAGGMRMAPHADPADGEINIQIFSCPKRMALTLKPMVQRGRHLDHRKVHLMTGTDFSIRTDQDWPVEADGEYLGHGDLTGRVIPKPLLLKV